MSYCPQEGSIAYKVIEFLTTNPEERLTSEDVSAKFDCPSKQVHSMLARAVETGVLLRRPGDEGDLEYSLGTGVTSIRPSKARAPSLRAALAWVMAEPRKAHPNVDLAALTIEKGVPLLTAKGRVATDWPALFMRMEVNDSCVLPKHVRGQLAKAAAIFKKQGHGELVVRAQDDDAIRIWRTK